MLIQRIVISYKRTVLITREDNPIPGEEGPMVIEWTRTEKVVLDRKTETITIFRKLAEACGVSIKYHSEEGVSSFLDDLDSDTLFVEKPSETIEIVDKENETLQYKISVLFDDGSKRNLRGNYNYNELPVDYADFMDSLFEFIRFYGYFGELFDDALYAKPQSEDERDGSNPNVAIIIKDGTTLPTTLGKTLEKLADDFYGLNFDCEYDVRNADITFKYDDLWYSLLPDSLGIDKNTMAAKSKEIVNALEGIGAKNVNGVFN